MITEDQVLKQQEEEMYRWFMQAAEAACMNVGVNFKTFRDSKATDDIVQDFMLELLKTPEKTREIYENRNIGIVIRMVKRVIYERRGQMLFKNKMDYSRYQKIERTCQEYNIKIAEENAYKISEMMNCELSIPVVVNLIRTKFPTAYENKAIREMLG